MTDTDAWQSYLAFETSWYAIVPGLVLWVLQVIGVWATFQKAGRPGWAAIIPFYNAYTYSKVGGKPGWWWVLWLIPIVNIVITIITALAIAKNFGRGGAFGFWLLWFLPYIGYMILGFGSSRYQPVGGTATDSRAAV
jgi:hypothetical protein